MPSKSLASHPDGQRPPDIPLSMAYSHLRLNTSKTNPSPPLRTCSFLLSPLHCAWGIPTWNLRVIWESCSPFIHPDSQVPEPKTLPVGQQPCPPLFPFTILLT